MESIVQIMNIQTENITVQKIMALAQSLPLVDQCTLVNALNQKIDGRLPERASIEEAIALYLTEMYSLSRAAELARMNRWEFLDTLKKS